MLGCCWVTTFRGCLWVRLSMEARDVIGKQLRYRGAVPYSLRNDTAVVSFLVIKKTLSSPNHEFRKTTFHTAAGVEMGQNACFWSAFLRCRYNTLEMSPQFVPGNMARDACIISSAAFETISASR